MSKVRTLALGALMIAGIAGVSEAQASSTPRTRADSGYHRRGPEGRAGARAEGRRGGEGFAFARDLNLTDAQKAQIKAIRQKYQPQQQALRTQAKPFLNAARTARQNKDSVAFRTNMEKAQQVLKGGDTYRTQEMAEIRNVLTPDQRAKFDARQKEFAERRAKDGAKGHGKGFGRAGRRGTKPAAAAKS
jgi:Spy/CpxP family protein refolding chaperone